MLASELYPAVGCHGRVSHSIGRKGEEARREKGDEEEWVFSREYPDGGGGGVGPRGVGGGGGRGIRLRLRRGLYRQT